MFNLPNLVDTSYFDEVADDLNWGYDTMVSNLDRADGGLTNPADYYARRGLAILGAPFSAMDRVGTNHTGKLRSGAVVTSVPAPDNKNTMRRGRKSMTARGGRRRNFGRGRRLQQRRDDMGELRPGPREPSTRVPIGVPKNAPKPPNLAAMRRTGGKMVNGKQLNSFVRSFPPVSYTRNVRSGARVQFEKGRLPGCLRVRLHFRVAQIGVQNVNSGAPVKGIVFMNLGPPGSGYYDQFLPINPAMTYYYPNFVTNLCTLFETMYINGCAIHVEPRVNTTNTAAAVLGYVEDPAWPESHNLYDASGHTYMNETAVTSLQNACTDVLYRGCVVGSPGMDRKKKFYVASPNFSTQIVFTAATTPDLRLSVNGGFVIAGVINGSDPVNTIYSDVYMNLDFELCGFTLAITSNVTLLRKQRDEKSRPPVTRGESDEKENKVSFNDEFTVIPTPGESPIRNRIKRPTSLKGTSFG